MTKILTEAAKLLLGVAVGATLSYWWTRRRGRKIDKNVRTLLRTEIDENTTALSDYQESVKKRIESRGFQQGPLRLSVRSGSLRLSELPEWRHQIFDGLVSSLSSALNEEQIREVTYFHRRLDKLTEMHAAIRSRHSIHNREETIKRAAKMFSEIMGEDTSAITLNPDGWESFEDEVDDLIALGTHLHNCLQQTVAHVTERVGSTKEKSGKNAKQRAPRFNSEPWDSIEQVVEAYAAHLQKFCSSQELDKFNRILKENPEAARAEAVVFSWLFWNGFSPEINDNPRRGGADFLCHPRSGENFVIEVSSLDSVAVSNRSKWPKDPGNVSGGAFGLITKNLQAKAISKEGQVSKSSLPRIVAITSEHQGAGALLSREGAVNLFVSDWSLAIPIGTGFSYLKTGLQHAVFFGINEEDPGKIVVRLTDISALLLVPILPHEIRPIGIIHPQPNFTFSTDSMPTVPFLRLKTWPITEGKIETEWTSQEYHTWRHKRVKSN